LIKKAKSAVKKIAKDSGFRIQDSGFRIQDSGFRIQDWGRGWMGWWMILGAGLSVSRRRRKNYQRSKLSF
jgi:MYXO-CTERM domain-containing protein